MTYEDVKRIRENPDSESPDNKELSKLIDEAVKKQIPKKPHKYHYPKIIKKGVCPRCLQTEDDSANYCRACGQALDWNHCGGKI